MECVGLLLQCEGVEVNAEDMKGEATPLQYSVLAGHEAAVDLLLSYGASCGPERSCRTSTPCGSARPGPPAPLRTSSST